MPRRRPSSPGCVVSRKATLPMASPGANGTSASRAAGNWPRPRGASRRSQCPPQVEEGLLHAVVVLADHAGGLVAPGARAGS
ncbi:hypothetical protein G6F66_014807 [Rhizopus arrhizus]|nr:hypothetical protein G6F66_014807 [Rhizopus arrhizus]